MGARMRWRTLVPRLGLRPPTGARGMDNGRFQASRPGSPQYCRRTDRSQEQFATSGERPDIRTGGHICSSAITLGSLHQPRASGCAPRARSQRWSRLSTSFQKEPLDGGLPRPQAPTDSNLKAAIVRVGHEGRDSPSGVPEKIGMVTRPSTPSVFRKSPPKNPLGPHETCRTQNAADWAFGVSLVRHGRSQALCRDGLMTPYNGDRNSGQD